HDAGAVLAALNRRDRQKRQRPLLLFGVLTTLLLLLATRVLAAWNAGRVLADANASLIKQIKEDDLYSARLVAYKVQDEIEDRIRLWNNHAARSERHVLIQKHAPGSLKLNNWVETAFAELSKTLENSDSRKEELELDGRSEHGPGQGLIQKLWIMNPSGVLIA